MVIVQAQFSQEALKDNEDGWLFHIAKENANERMINRFTTPSEISAGRLGSGKHHIQIIHTRLNTIIARSRGGRKRCGFVIPCQANPLLKNRISWAIKSTPKPKSKRFVYGYLLVRFPIKTVSKVAKIEKAIIR
jgi:hypothetical protein